MAFGNPIIGSNDELVRDKIRSENYVAGVSGWQIERDGTAEFNDVTVRGELEVGTPPNPQVIIDSDAGSGRIQFPTGSPVEADPTILRAERENPGAIFEDLSFRVEGPQVTGAAGSSLIQMRSPRNDNSDSAMVTLQAAGSGLAQLQVTGDGELIIFESAGWTTYTPTWGATTTNPTLGNGTLVGTYKELGKTVAFRIHLTLGSTSSAGSGRYTFTLPVTATGTQTCGAFIADGSTRYACSAILTSGTGVFAIAYGTGAAGVQHNVPFAFGNGDQIAIAGTYEAA